MHLRVRILLTLWLLSAARRNMRADELHRGVLHRSNTLIKALGVAAKAREVFLPGSLGKALVHVRGPPAVALHATHGKAPRKHRGPGAALVGPRRARVPLQSASVLEDATALAGEEAAAAEKAAAEKDNRGDTIFMSTKHIGKSFRDVNQLDPDWAEWALRLEEPGGQLAEFVDYIRSSGTSRSRSPPRNRGDTMFRGTKHVGKSFRDVKQLDPDWAEWALRLEEPKGQVAEFVDYIQDGDDGSKK